MSLTTIVSELATVDEFAREMRCSNEQVRRMLRDGTIEGYKWRDRGEWRIPWSEVHHLRTRHRSVPAPGRHRRMADRSAA
jgi:excisionase family DNA binding protein